MNGVYEALGCMAYKWVVRGLVLVSMSIAVQG